MGYLDKGATYIVAGAGSLYAFVSGNTSVAFQILLMVMALDIISGVLKGIQKKNLRSIFMHVGLMKKAGLILAVTFGYVLDIAVNGGQPIFATMMTWAGIGNEGLSVVENLETLGVKMPKVITEKLAQVSDENDKLRKDKG